MNQNISVFCLFFVILVKHSGLNAETMCASSDPMPSPKTLTSVDYPAMVTAAQCQCMIIPAQPIEELDIQVQLRRSDRTVDCSRTQMTVVHHNLSSVICPTVDGQLMSSGHKNNRTLMTISLSVTKNDRPVITLWNSHLDFLNVQVVLTSPHPVPYNIVCTYLEGSLYWPYEDQNLGFDDGIDSGVKVAIVVLFFILVVLISTLIRLIVRLRLRQRQIESQKQQARLKRITRLKQATAFDNLGYSSSTLNHSSNNSFLQYSGKPNDSGNLALPTALSASPSTAGYNGMNPQNITGHGGIWPLDEDELYRPTVKRPTHTVPQDTSSGFVPNRSSKQVHYANDTLAAGGRQKHLPSMSHQTPSLEAQTATVSRSTYRKSFPDALAPTRIGSNNELLGLKAASPSADTPLALVHQRQHGKSWRKNDRTRRFHVEDNGQHQKTFDEDQPLSISTNTTHPNSSSRTNGAMPTVKRVYDTFGVDLSTTSRDQMPRESEI